MRATAVERGAGEGMRGPRNTRKTRKFYRRERREQRALGLINTLLQGGVGRRAKDLNCFSSFPSPLFSPFAPVKSVPFGVFRVFRGLNSGQMAFGKVLKLVTKG